MRHRGFGLLVIFALICACPVTLAAQAVTTPVAATEVFDPMNMMGNGSIGYFSQPGTITCPGGEPTGNPLQPCPPGTPIHVRDAIGASRLSSASAQLRGWFGWTMNANFDAAGAGRAWGTFRIDLEEGGTWEGSWVNERAKVQDVNMWIGHARFVGRGESGPVLGMHIRFTETGATHTILPFFWVASIEGEVLTPPSR